MAGTVQFNSTDRAQAASLASPLASTTGAKTAAVLCKRDAIGTDYDALMYTKSGAGNGTTEWGLSFKDTNLAFVDKGVTTSSTIGTFASTTAPVIVVAGRAGGAAQAMSYSYYNRISESSKNLTTPFGVASTDTFTCAAHGYANGDEVYLPTLTGGAGLSTTGRYFIINQATNTFQLATTVGGSAVNFTTDVSAGAVLRTGHWTHDIAVGTLGDGVTATMLELGAFEQTGDFLRAHFGLGGIWASNLSQANREVLSLNWRTSDWYANPGGTPVCLIQGNTATPTDLIGNATSWTYTGLTLDGAETLMSFNFDGTGASAPVNTVAPAVTGDAITGETLTCSDGTWTGSPTPTYAKQWHRSLGGASGTNEFYPVGEGTLYEEITGETGDTYDLTSTDEDEYVWCVVTATNTAGSVAEASNEVGPVQAEAGDVPVNSVAPAVTGTARLGRTLSTTNGTWSNTPTGYAYEWQRDTGGGFTPIGGATSSTYVLQIADLDADVRCEVTASNAEGAGTAANSNDVGPVEGSTVLLLNSAGTDLVECPKFILIDGELV